MVGATVSGVVAAGAFLTGAEVHLNPPPPGSFQRWQTFLQRNQLRITQLVQEGNVLDRWMSVCTNFQGVPDSLVRGDIDFGPDLTPVYSVDQNRLFGDQRDALEPPLMINPYMLWIADPHLCKIPPTQHQSSCASAHNRRVLTENPHCADSELLFASNGDTTKSVMGSTSSANFTIPRPPTVKKDGTRGNKCKQKYQPPLPTFRLETFHEHYQQDILQAGAQLERYYAQHRGRRLPAWLVGDIMHHRCPALLEGPRAMYVWYPMQLDEQHYGTHSVYVTLVMRIHTLERMIMNDELNFAGRRLVTSLQDALHFMTFFMTDTGRFSDAQLSERIYRPMMQSLVGDHTEQAVRVAMAQADRVWEAVDRCNERDSTGYVHCMRYNFESQRNRPLTFLDLVKPTMNHVVTSGQLPNMTAWIIYNFCNKGKTDNIPFSMSEDLSSLYDVIKKCQPKHMGLRATNEIVEDKSKSVYIVYKTMYLLIFAMYCGYYKHCNPVPFCIRNTVYRYMAYDTASRSEFRRWMFWRNSVGYDRRTPVVLHHPKMLLYSIREYVASCINGDRALLRATMLDIANFDTLISNWCECGNQIRRFMMDSLYGCGSNYVRAQAFIDIYHTVPQQAAADKIERAKEVQDEEGCVVNPPTKRKQKACTKPSTNMVRVIHELSRAFDRIGITDDTVRTVRALDDDGFVRINQALIPLCYADDSKRAERPEDTPNIPFVSPEIVRAAVRLMVEMYYTVESAERCPLDFNCCLTKNAAWIAYTDGTKHPGESETVNTIIRDVRARATTPEQAEVSLFCTDEYLQALSASAWVYQYQRMNTKLNKNITSSSFLKLCMTTIARKLFHDAMPTNMWPAGYTRSQYAQVLVRRYCGDDILSVPHSDCRHATYKFHPHRMIMGGERCTCQHCAEDQFGVSRTDHSLYLEYQEALHRGELAPLLFGSFMLDPAEQMLDISYHRDLNDMYRVPPVDLYAHITSVCATSILHHEDNAYLKRAILAITEFELRLIQVIIRQHGPHKPVNPLWMVLPPLSIEREPTEKFIYAMHNLENNSYPSHMMEVMFQMCVAYPRTFLLIFYMYSIVQSMSTPMVYHLPLRILRQQICSIIEIHNPVPVGQRIPQQCTMSYACLVHGDIKAPRANGDISVVGTSGCCGVHIEPDTNEVYCAVPLLRRKAHGKEGFAECVVRAIEKMQYEQAESKDQYGELRDEPPDMSELARAFGASLFKIVQSNQIVLPDELYIESDSSGEEDSHPDTKMMMRTAMRQKRSMTMSAERMSRKHGVSPGQPDGEDAKSQQQSDDEERSSVSRNDMRHSVKPREKRLRGRQKASQSRTSKARMKEFMDDTTLGLFLELHGKSKLDDLANGVVHKKKRRTRKNMIMKRQRDSLDNEPLKPIDMLGIIVDFGNSQYMLCPLCKTLMKLAANSFGPLGISCGECTKTMLTKIPKLISDYVRFVCLGCMPHMCLHKVGEVTPIITEAVRPTGVVLCVEYYCKTHLRDYMNNVPMTTLQTDLDDWLKGRIRFIKVGGYVMAVGQETH